MSYRTILLSLQDDAQNEARIRLASRLAERFEARLVGLHVAPLPLVPVGYGEGAAYLGPELIESQRKAERIVAERLRRSFEATATRGAGGAVFAEVEGVTGDSLGEAARAADLTLVPQSAATGIDALPAQPVERAVMAAGGPVLMLPQGGWEGDIGKEVLCAWNGSREAARALKDAMPFLAEATRVTLLGIGESRGPGLAEVAAMLGRHEITASTLQQDEDEDVGAILRRTAAERSCDLLVMGAYGHSRMRELILGGATRDMLRQAALPVLLSA
jgi:nucleotide-binding universal stress UspA family protein